MNNDRLMKQFDVNDQQKKTSYLVIVEDKTVIHHEGMNVLKIIPGTDIRHILKPSMDTKFMNSPIRLNLKVGSREILNSNLSSNIVPMLHMRQELMWSCLYEPRLG